MCESFWSNLTSCFWYPLKLLKIDDNFVFVVVIVVCFDYKFNTLCILILTFWFIQKPPPHMCKKKKNIFLYSFARFDADSLNKRDDRYEIEQNVGPSLSIYIVMLFHIPFVLVYFFFCLQLFVCAHFRLISCFMKPGDAIHNIRINAMKALLSTWHVSVILLFFPFILLSFICS